MCDAQSGVVVPNSSPESQLWGLLQELLQGWALMSLRAKNFDNQEDSKPE